MILAVTGLGLCSPLGSSPIELARQLDSGARGLRPHAPLEGLPGGSQAGCVEGPDIRRWLRKRKDKKLLARASALSLVAAGEALGDWPGDRSDLGLFWGVGREPPDDGECEASLAAACQGGVLNSDRLAGRGRDLYPPLLPLKTLPNMALAHISINLGIGGENGAWAGGCAAGLRAILAGYWAVVEGRAPAALVGAGNSLVDLGSARDRLRMGETGPPGEAAAALLLEPLDSAWSRAAPIHCLIEPEPPGNRPGEGRRGLGSHCPSLGDSGATNGVLSVLLGLCEVRAKGRNLTVHGRQEGVEGQGVRLRKPGPC
jgi:3-oxoacyl-(acyl-carrier-protein) synthase